MNRRHFHIHRYLSSPKFSLTIFGCYWLLLLTVTIFVTLIDIDIDVYSPGIVKEIKHYKWKEFRWKEMHPKAAIYFLKYHFFEIKKHINKVKICKSPIELEKAIPIHSNGQIKKENDYYQLLSQDNIKLLFKGEEQLHQIRSDSKSFMNVTEQNSREKNEEKDETKVNQSIEQRNNINFTLIYLLCIHENPKQIKKMIKAMSDEKNEKEIAFILSIDLKSNLSEYYEVLTKQIQKKNIFFVSPQLSVMWGHITLTMSEIILLQAAIKYFPNSLYYSIHSGNDYPLVPTDFIVQFFKENYPKNFIISKSFLELNETRLQEAFIFLSSFGNSSKLKAGENYTNNIDWDKTFPMIRFVPNRVIPKRKYGLGSNWFTISAVSAKMMMKYLFERDFKIIEFMDYVHCSDEIFFQTLLHESNLTTENTNLRFIHFIPERKNPLILESEHFNMIVKNPMNFWARKIKYPQSRDLIKRIDQHIKKMSLMSYTDFKKNITHKSNL